MQNSSIYLSYAAYKSWCLRTIHIEEEMKMKNNKETSAVKKQKRGKKQSESMTEKQSQNVEIDGKDVNDK